MYITISFESSNSCFNIPKFSHNTLKFVSTVSTWTQIVLCVVQSPMNIINFVLMIFSIISMCETREVGLQFLACALLWHLIPSFKDFRMFTTHKKTFENWLKPALSKACVHDSRRIVRKPSKPVAEHKLVSSMAAVISLPSMLM